VTVEAPCTVSCSREYNWIAQRGYSFLKLETTVVWETI